MVEDVKNLLNALCKCQFSIKADGRKPKTIQQIYFYVVKIIRFICVSLLIINLIDIWHRLSMMVLIFWAISQILSKMFFSSSIKYFLKIDLVSNIETSGDFISFSGFLVSLGSFHRTRPPCFMAPSVGVG